MDAMAAYATQGSFSQELTHFYTHTSSVYTRTHSRLLETSYPLIHSLAHKACSTLPSPADAQLVTSQSLTCP
jgi:hypothetical protein